MKRAIVTGAAGFIGSHLCERLLKEGFAVTGVDSLNDYYDVRIKRANLEGFIDDPRFTLIEKPIAEVDWTPLLSVSTVIFHQAAQAGVRSSWGRNFEGYIDSNIRATQILLEAARGKGIEKFVYASSSSVYGDTAELPMSEGHRTQPVSPYGVTKLSGEHLCLLYAKNYGLPVVSLRYFTVYGPRQRPDMAFHIFIRRALGGEPIEVFGNGTQTRDFTYVHDIVQANLLAASYGGDRTVFNIGGGSRITLNTALDILGDHLGRGLEVRYSDPVKGDVMHTYADISLAEKELGYRPSVDFETGIAREIEWVERIYGKLGESD